MNWNRQPRYTSLNRMSDHHCHWTNTSANIQRYSLCKLVTFRLFDVDFHSGGIMCNTEPIFPIHKVVSCVKLCVRWDDWFPHLQKCEETQCRCCPQHNCICHCGVLFPSTTQLTQNPWCNGKPCSLRSFLKLASSPFQYVLQLGHPDH